jgi:hypothetical protein
VEMEDMPIMVKTASINSAAIVTPPFELFI